MLTYLGENKIWSNMLGNIEFRALQEANGYDSFGYRTYGSSSSQMKAYKAYTTPPDNVWIDVGEGVQLKVCKVTIGTSDVKTEKSLRCIYVTTAAAAISTTSWVVYKTGTSSTSLPLKTIPATCTPHSLPSTRHSSLM
jgi:hypothetical protein